MSELGSVLEGYVVCGEPLVSVRVIAYNHGKYIRKCLDGVLMQIVNFPYEVIVHDDASPDDTADIIREYEAKYPQVIKAIYQTVNQHSQGISASKFVDEMIRGKYIAQCEGDDYWSDENKLQTQIEFLENNPQYIASAHSMTVINENGEPIPPQDGLDRLIYAKDWVYTIKEVEMYLLPGQTATIVYRNIFDMMSKDARKAYYSLFGWGDRKLSASLTAFGDIYCFGKNMSAYRYVISGGTSWSARTRNQNIYGDTLKYLINIQEFVTGMLNKEMRTYEASLCTYIAALMLYLRHPNKANADVMKIMKNELRNNPSYLKNGIKRVLSHPISFAKRTWETAMIRRKTVAQLMR